MLSGLFHMPGEQLLEIENKAACIYDKYGISEPPTKHSKMDRKQKIHFFLDYLAFYDSGSALNSHLETGVKCFLNRRYNNAFRHAMEHLSQRDKEMLVQKMAKKKIGGHNRL